MKTRARNMERFSEWYLDVTAAPYFADPGGERDSTEAILLALDSLMERNVRAVQQTIEEVRRLPFETGRDPRGVENRREQGRNIVLFPAVIPYVPTLYFPEGTYRISDTICHRHTSLRNGQGKDMTMQLRIRGDGPGRSILKLTDDCEGFSGEDPKPILRILKGESTNVAMSNYVEQLTIDSGRGNPAAVGLDFYANNSGAVRNVRIRSGDGLGKAGFCIGRGNPSGMLIQDLEVDGFEYGAHLDTPQGTMFMAGERWSLSNQRRAAVYAGDLSMSLRGVHCVNAPLGVEFASPHGFLVLVDSLLEGTGKAAFQIGKGAAYVSNVTTGGFDRKVATGDGLDCAPLDFTADGGRCRRVDPAGIVPRLRVEDPPAFSPEQGRAVTVDAFGAVGDGHTDDALSIQRAMRSGAAQVHFGPGRYKLDAPIDIPPEVEQVCFHFCDLVTGARMASLKNQGVFVISGDTNRPLLFEKLFAWEQFRGECVTIDHASRRTLVIRDVHTQTLSLYRNSVEGGNVFLENAACTTGVVPGTPDHGRIGMVFKGQRVWARQLNPERGHPMVVNDGGTLWVLGFKTEDDATGFLTLNGGHTEILGGILNCGGNREPAFESRNASMRISATTNSWGGPVFDTVVNESGCVQARVMAHELPSRNFDGHRAHLFSLPLYGSVPESGSTDSNHFQRPNLHPSPAHL